MFYSKIVALSKKRGTNISNVISELQLSSGNLSKWKAGGMPKADTISKLADYFHVSTDYLLGRTDNPSPMGEEKGPAPVSGSEPSYPPEYDTLTPANKAIADQLIISLAQAQQSAPSPTKLYIAARDGSRMEVEVDGELTLPDEDDEIP